ncbi:hypothetical protein OG413_41875 [Streptomyces sp. NBC_01433]|uniref:hypothetical protein n=1 Tax=Streptomyces sp. NBC_01433 TaxID=2903864 RepID=UPI00225823FC|nr:hypothetical protein [Streptomyces sp. NBC_01433]MCX4681754.1 hypothetical protein [Streptomyces sp. NBC_01433]
MRLYLAIPVVLLALLIAASGVAALTRGWVLPTNRLPVRRPRLYGWGQLVVALALCWQVAFLLLLSDPDTRQWGTLTGSVLLLTGLLVMMVSRRTGGHRQDA